MNHHRTVNQQRRRRQLRVRKAIRGTPQRPRLTVHRSLKHIYAQLVDDQSGKTLAAASTVEAELGKQAKYGGNCSAATLVGQALAERAKAAGITAAAFDRGHCRYHGRVAALADGARQAGLSI